MPEVLGENLERQGPNASLGPSSNSSQQAFRVSPIPSTFRSGYVPAHGSRYCNASKKGCRKGCHGGSVFFADQCRPETDPGFKPTFSSLESKGTQRSWRLTPGLWVADKAWVLSPPHTLD